jgi:hypothetical protein
VLTSLLLLLLLPHRSGWSQTVPTMPAGELPLHKVFVKSQLDLMTANAWMAGASMMFCRQLLLLLLLPTGGTTLQNMLQASMSHQPVPVVRKGQRFLCL